MSHPLAGYSLWLAPSSAEHAPLSGIIKSLTSHEAASPIFDPHITLLHPIPGPLEHALAVIRGIAATFGQKYPGSLELNLLPAQSGSHYYQSVLAPVEPAESLLHLRKLCEDAFESHPPSYFPHLSLLYGDLTKERRDELAAVVNEGSSMPKHVHLAEMIVVDCLGTVKDWKVAGRVPL